MVDDVLAHGVVATHQAGNAEFGADAVRVGDKDGVFVSRHLVERAKSADISQDAGGEGGSG